MLVLAGLALVAAVVIARLVVGGGGNGSSGPSGSTTTAAERTHGKPPARRAHAVLRLAERSLAALPEPLQDAAFAPLDGGRTVLLGGLTAADTSSDSILVAAGAGARRVGALPGPLHDAAAVRIGSFAYLFGGGDGVRQLDAILRVDPRTGRTEVVGRLPAPSSDQSAAEIDGTAYVIGGFTGSEWLNTVVAWRPGSRAHVVARLPTAVRYAAVAAAGGKIVVAGGSLPNGTAGDAVLVFDPATGRVARVARLPAPTTHAAAAAIGDVAYVIGGRGTAVGTPTDRIAALDLATGRVRAAGRLASPRSDLAAVASGTRILLAGGRGPTGTESSISELVPEREMAAARAQNVYSFDKAEMLTGAARTARSLVYVPNSESATVDVIDPRTYKIVEHFRVGALPQHVVPAWNLERLYVTNDLGNSLTPIDPRTGKPGRAIPVDDPYNMYFTPDGRFAIVVAERLRRLDFRDPHTFELRHSLSVPCVGVDHMDFSADGSYLLASCEFSGQMVKVDVKGQRVVGVLDLPDGRGGMPQDVKLSPDGSVFYVADMRANGLWKIDGDRLKVVGFLPTGQGVHGLYPSRDAGYLYATNRSEGSISVISFRTGKVVRKWWIPGGGSPDMGGVSADGKVLWLSGRYSGVVYAISTRNGRLLAKIPVGSGPHGLCVWPQPGRYSLGHTGNMR
jgi:DNA-binding beta-propeller fold protein YncE